MIHFTNFGQNKNFHRNTKTVTFTKFLTQSDTISEKSNEQILTIVQKCSMWAPKSSAYLILGILKMFLKYLKQSP